MAACGGVGRVCVKRIIICRLCIVIVIFMIVGIGTNYYIQVQDAQKTAYTNGTLQLLQIEKILETNENDLAELKESLQEDYFIRAKAAAYIVENNPEITTDLAEMRKVAALLQVDELHLFNKEGVLYAGSEPKYYNMTFDSGEQMRFFLPMLSDTSLQLCQDVTPNTAEKKLMQYVAVWREDKEEIIQIGMEPIRLIEAMEKNELPYIFERIPTEEGVSVFAMDYASGQVLGTTNGQLQGMTAQALCLPWEQISEPKAFVEGQLRFADRAEYCILRRIGDVVIGISSSKEAMYQRIPENMWLVSISLFLLGTIIVLLIYSLLNHYIIQGIEQLIAGMGKIAAGDLDYRVAVERTPEFTELSGNINHLVGNLLETTGKMSLIFENVDIPVAAYEYHKDMKRVLATSKLGRILGMSDAEIHSYLKDRDKFAGMIGTICSHSYEKDVYVLDGEDPHYIRYKSYREKDDVLGVFVDVTEDILERQRIEQERDVDVLTGLCSRRAFFYKMDRLTMAPGELRNAVLMMADMDRLKYVNDTYGHKYGDRILKEAAQLLESCEAPGKLAARLSGDEFVLFLYGADSTEKLRGYLEALHARMEKTEMQVSAAETVPVRLSGGYAFYPLVSDNYRELLRLADKALYLAKKTHKGSFEEYHATME